MTMYTKLVSVIVPIYNAEKNLEKCIKSIRNQSYSNIEVILVNDGSIDNSLDICYKASTEDSRIYVIDIENSGVSFARNKGIENAKGEYCCFVDSDDWLEKEHIKKLVFNIKNTDGVISGYIKDSGLRQDKYKLTSMIVDLNELEGKTVGKIFWDGYVHPCWNKLFKRDILLKNNLVFEHKIHISEDSLFCIRYLECCKSVAVMSDTTYHYCIDKYEVSLSKKIYPNIFDIYAMVYNELERLLERGKCEENIKNEILTRTIYPQLYSAISKILLNNTMTRIEKKKILNQIEKNLSCQRVLINAGQISENKTEKLILKLAMKKKYFLLELIWKSIVRKSQ